MRRVGQVLLIVIAAGCGSNERAAPASSVRTDAAVASRPFDSAAYARMSETAVRAVAPEIRRVSADSVRLNGVGLHMGFPEVLARLGEPARRISRGYADGVADTVRVWEYPQLIVEFWGATVAGLSCTRAPCATSGGVGLGDPAATVERTYGALSISTPDDSTRVVSIAPGGCALVVRLRAQRVAALNVVCEI